MRMSQLGCRIHKYKLPDLGEISLSNNQLTGALSASLGNFSSLQKLLLDQNVFYGAIPRDIEANCVST